MLLQRAATVGVSESYSQKPATFDLLYFEQHQYRSCGQLLVQDLLEACTPGHPRPQIVRREVSECTIRPLNSPRERITFPTVYASASSVLLRAGGAEDVRKVWNARRILSYHPADNHAVDLLKCWCFSSKYMPSRQPNAPASSEKSETQHMEDRRMQSRSQRPGRQATHLESRHLGLSAQTHSVLSA